MRIFPQDLGYPGGGELLGKEEEQPFNLLHPLPGHLCSCFQELSVQGVDWAFWLQLHELIKHSPAGDATWPKPAHIQPMRHPGLAEQDGSIQNISWEWPLARASP